MAQAFPPSANTLARGSLAVGAVAALASLWLLYELSRSPYLTQAGVTHDQPVPFSHLHHVAGVGIDCRYCHTSVEASAVAGLPPTKLCMNCHSQIWAESPALEPVRRSARENTPIRWVRVHDLPDFVYFDHSAHVNRGVGCSTCHGRVDRMALARQEASLLMEWCLECHRSPERFLRPQEAIFDMTWEPPRDQREQGRALVAAYGIHTRTSCSTCHR
jgi:hypothetical protein